MDTTRTAYRCTTTCPEMAAAQAFVRAAMLASGLVECHGCDGLCVARYRRDGKPVCVACFTHGSEPAGAA